MTTLSRRTFLKGMGALAAMTVGTRLLPETPATTHAAPPRTRAVGAPPMPPLAVVALTRLAFGPRPGDPETSLEAFNALGGNDAARLTAWVDRQLDPASIPDPECDSALAAAGLTTQSKTLNQLWVDHFINFNDDYNIRNRPWLETRLAAWVRATLSRRQLFEVLTDFWFNHFNVFANDYGGVAATFPHYYNQVIRAHTLGNFRTMLEAVAQAPAMLFYLDNNSSQGAQFNENFARELCELHTLGAENYLGVGDPSSVPLEPFTFPGSVPGYWYSPAPSTPPTQITAGYVDNDVYEIARCFTGWRVNDNRTWLAGITNTGEFQYWNGWHDRANKWVLGKYFRADAGPLYDAWKALDMLAYHPGTARFIARKLCRRLVSDDPPASLVASAAQVFLDHRRSPDQLKRVVRHIVLAGEFSATWGDKVKRPFEAVVSALRACGQGFNLNMGALNSQHNNFFWAFSALGQPTFERTPPDGFPDRRAAWTGTNTQLRYWNLLNNLLEGDSWAFPALKPDVSALMPGSVNTPAAIVDFWVNRVLGRPMHPPANRDALLVLMQGWSSPSPTVTPVYAANQVMDASHIAARLPRLVSTLLMSPDFLYR